MHLDLNNKQRTLQPQLGPANINPVSFLATDYLNHFNEIVMLMEMIPDMPDMIEDLLEWSPKGYKQHFLDSGFKDKDLAVEAYDNAPDVFKAPFDKTVADLDKLLSATISGMARVGIAERGLSDAARTLVETRIAQAQTLMADLNGLIHGKVNGEVITQETVTEQVAEVIDEDTTSQQDIDALFE